MKKYIHIGFAKCCSTWLQHEFFPKNDQLYHLGKFPGSETVDDEIQLAFRSELIESSEFLYDEKFCIQAFNKHFKLAKSSSGIKAVGISHELLTNSINGRVDIAERARRIAKIFNYKAEIIMIIRNQFDWIRSFYAGLVVEGGITLDFEKFLFYFFYDKDRSSMYNLYYDKVYNLYSKLFGKRHVHVIPYELIKNGKHTEFLSEISNAIGIDMNKNFDIESKNQARSAKLLSLILKKNKEYSYCLNGNIFERPWGFKHVPIYKKKYDVDAPDNLLKQKEYYSKIYALTENDVLLYEKNNEEIDGIELHYNTRYKTLLNESYAVSNCNLQKISKINLEKFSYPGC